MNKNGFKPIQAADLVGLASEKNAKDDYIVADLGPATPVEKLLTQSERPYLVEGVLTQGSLALLSAESFVGKTFFGIELARAVATGTLFLGKYKVERGGVLYIAQDGSEEEYVRQWRKLARGHWTDYGDKASKWLPQWEKFQAGEKFDHATFADMPFHPFNDRLRFYFNRALGIDIADDVTKIGLTALRMEHSLGEVWSKDENGQPTSIDPSATEKGVKLIVFDAGHSVFFGNENDSGEVQNVMTNLRQLAIATGATVLLMVHLNKFSPQQQKGMPKVSENRVRGSGVFQSAPDWHVQLHRGHADGEVYAFQLKDRAGNRCKSFIYSMTFEDESQKMTLSHVRDMMPEEHRDRKVKPSLAGGDSQPEPTAAVEAEFKKGLELSREDVADALGKLPQFTKLASSTLKDKAKDFVSDLEKRGVIAQTKKPSNRQRALYKLVT